MATTYPQPCIQPVPGTDRVIGSEDCLALNVFTPDLPTGTEGIGIKIDGAVIPIMILLFQGFLLSYGFTVAVLDTDQLRSMGYGDIELN